MTSSAAAEYLRGYAPAGVSLAEALDLAERATYRASGDAHARVQEAARVLGRAQVIEVTADAPEGEQ
jgi:hypothetical protein